MRTKGELRQGGEGEPRGEGGGQHGFSPTRCRVPYRSLPFTEGRRRWGAEIGWSLGIHCLPACPLLRRSHRSSGSGDPISEEPGDRVEGEGIAQQPLQ